MTERAILSLPIAEIEVGERIGFFNIDHTARLSISMAAEGQHSPIHVKRNGNAAKRKWKLVAGLHRLRGAEAIPWTRIDAVQVADASASASELRRLELSENVDHRHRRPIERAILMVAHGRLEEEIDHPGHVGETIAADAPIVPEWFDTPTSERLTSLLSWAQSGEIVLIVTTPGIGKTRVAERFADNDPNVWLATMSPSTAGVATMAIEVAEAIGLGEITGSPQQLSRKIKGRVRGKKGLLIVDEAQELTDKALNELRGWHDRTKVGIVLMGNETVVGQLDGRKSALAQISSRFSIRHVQIAPMPGDMEALLDAWQITDVEQRSFLTKIGRLPGALREMTHTIKIAHMNAFGTGRQLTLAHLRDAARQRNVKVGAL